MSFLSDIINILHAELLVNIAKIINLKQVLKDANAKIVALLNLPANDVTKVSASSQSF